jgi:hypothetical protein
MQRNVSLGQGHINIGQWTIGNVLFGLMNVQYRKTATLQDIGFFGVKIRGKSTLHGMYE